MTVLAVNEETHQRKGSLGAVTGMLDTASRFSIIFSYGFVFHSFLFYSMKLYFRIRLVPSDRMSVPSSLATSKTGRETRNG